MKNYRVWLANNMNELAGAQSCLPEEAEGCVTDCVLLRNVTENELKLLLQFTQMHGSAIAIMNECEESDNE